MKKLFAILCALACLAMLCIPALAAPDGIDSLAVVGSGIPGVGEWKPEDPAGDMTEVSDSVYEKTLELTANQTMTFKIAGNDKWDDTCNFGGASLVLGETADLPISTLGGDMVFTAEKDMTLKITVDLTAFASGSGAKITLTEVTEGGDEPVAPPVEEPTEPSEDPTEPTEEPTEAPAEDEDPTEAPSEGEGEEDTTKPTTAQKEKMTDAERRAARTKVYIVLAVALVVIIGIACVLSIPKKIG